MPRNGSGVFSLASTYEAISGEVIEAQQHNDPLEDLEQDANTARPIVAGGTGATTAAAAATALGVGAASAVTHASLTLTSTDADAAAGPILTLRRDSASPLAADLIGRLLLQGEDSAGNTEDYASIDGVIADPTSGSEDGSVVFWGKVAGAMTRMLGLTGAFGTVGQKPRVNSGATALEWESDWETIQQADFSAESALTWTGLSAFDELDLDIVLLPGTSATAFTLRSSTDGTNYDAGASDYFYVGLGRDSSSGALGGAASAATFQVGWNTLSNTVRTRYRAHLSRFNKAENCICHSIADEITTTGTLATLNIMTHRLQATARQALRASISSGTMSGRYTLRGRRG